MSDNPICSNIGSDILGKGGLAIDAAIAVALCLGVVSPASSGIGGGCFILNYKHDTQNASFIDARETVISLVYFIYIYIYIYYEYEIRYDM